MYTLKSAEGKELKMPVSAMAAKMEYIGTAVSDKDWYNWCISPIDDDEGKTHLFVSRWPARCKMGGWVTECEIAHFISDSAEGPFKYVETVLHNDIMPKGQIAPHNVHVKKIDGRYCMNYIVQTKKGVPDAINGQVIGLAVADSLNGPWKFVGEDGIVIRPQATGWTANSAQGTDNPDIMKVKDKYYIYFKAGLSQADSKYGYAVADKLEGPYTISASQITDNVNYIEDTTCFEWDGKYYLLTCDNFGDNTGVLGYGILWESEDGKLFKLADAKVGFGLMSDYRDIPENAAYPYGRGKIKFERPAVLMRDGKPAYFYASNGVNVDGFEATQNFVLKINL